MSQPSSPANSPANSTVICYLDFDQFVGYKVGHITALIVGIMTRCVEKGFARNRAAVRVLAFGTPNSFRDLDVLNQLTVLGVETRLVSSRKREETDRAIERDALDDRNGADVVCVVSNDQDFVGILRRLQLAGKKVIVVNSAEKNSLHAMNLSVFSDESWDWTEFGIPRNGEVAPSSSSGAGNKPTATTTRPKNESSAAAAAAASTAPSSSSSSRVSHIIEFGKTTPWRTDNKDGTLYTIVETTTTSAKILLSPQNFHYTSAENRPSEHCSAPVDVLVIALPPAEGQQQQQQQIVATAAFPLDWVVSNVMDPKDGSPVVVTVGELEPTHGLAMLLSAPAGSAEATAGKKMCTAPVGVPCKFGSRCIHLHRKSRFDLPEYQQQQQQQQQQQRRSSPDVVVLSSAWPAQYRNRVVMVEGVGYVPASELDPNRLFAHMDDSPQLDKAKPCQKWPECSYGSKCNYAHLKSRAHSRDDSLFGGRGGSVGRGRASSASAASPSMMYNRGRGGGGGGGSRGGGDFSNNSNNNNNNVINSVLVSKATAKAVEGSSVPDMPEVVLVEGKLTPVTSLERTLFFEYVKAHQDKSGAWCRHHQKGCCERGAGCQFVHAKK